MKIELNNKEIELKYSFRALMMYENVTGASLNPHGLTDIMTFFYCVVLSSSKDYTITFDDFVDYIDENPSKIGEFSEWLKKIVKSNSVIKKNLGNQTKKKQVSA